MKSTIMLCYQGKLSLGWFAGSALITSVILFEHLWGCFLSSFIGTERNIWWLLPTFLISSIIYLHALYSDFSYQVACRSFLLGSFFAVGFYLSFQAAPWYLFGLYLCTMCWFHYSEFLAIAWCNPATLSVDSFILNHSTEYFIAAIASWLEFGLEAFFIPGMKDCAWLSCLGICLCLGGEVLRKTAMVTAGSNFDHIVQTEKVTDHVLVTHGVYNLCRHPSYVGWFYWSLGTQLLLVNPICSCGYLLASWRFFRERIEVEEQTLLHFFGRDYVRYQQAVGTGLPGIQGYVLPDK